MDLMIALRKEDFLQQCEINLRKGTTVEGIDQSSQKVHLQNGETLHYDKLLVATGSTPRVPRVQGTDLQGVFTIRNINDCYKLRETAKQAKNIVILGASFIGLESAWSLKRDLKD